MHGLVFPPSARSVAVRSGAAAPAHACCLPSGLRRPVAVLSVHHVKLMHALSRAISTRGTGARR
eukprot:4890546-Alexandrium_andersonii.AAC.1